MFRRWLSANRPRPVSLPVHGLTTDDLVWIMGSFCALHQKPFDAGLFLRQFAPPYSTDTLIQAARALDFRIRRQDVAALAVASL